jgi:hypothetical protein
LQGQGDLQIKTQATCNGDPPFCLCATVDRV